MATSTKTTTENPSTDVSDLASTLREQVLAATTAGQKLSVDAARSWVRGLSALSRPEAADGVGARVADGVTSATGFAYDVASDLLGAQREFALAMTRTVTARPQA